MMKFMKPVSSLSDIYLKNIYIYITPVNNLPLYAWKPQMFTNIYNAQITKFIIYYQIFHVDFFVK